MKILIKRALDLEARFPNGSLFSVAVILRILCAWAVGPGNEEDGAYVEIARSLLKGEGYLLRGGFGLLGDDFVYKSWFPPGFGLFLAGFIWLFGESLEPIRYFFTLLSGFTAVAMARMGMRLAGRSGRVAGWIWAFYIPQIFWSTRVDSRSLAFFLFILALWLTLEAWANPKMSRIFGVGLAWGATILSRSEFLFVALGAAFWLLWTLKTNRFRFSFVLISALALAWSPWIIRNWRIHHKFIPLAANYAENIYMTFHSDYHFEYVWPGYSPQVREKARGRSETQAAQLIMTEVYGYIRDHPARSLYIGLGNLVHFWRPYLNPRSTGLAKNIVYTGSFIFLFALFLAGLREIKWRFDSAGFLIAMLIVLKWFSHSITYVIVSFREIISPLIILIAVLGLAPYFQSRSDAKPPN